MYCNHFLAGPGLEFMGSPPGFPTLPQSFWQPWSNNFQVLPNQTLQMFRTVVSSILVRYAARYGAAEVATWNLETWNEPECGWGWLPLNGNLSDPVFKAYTLMWDAVSAGVEDAEAEIGAKLILGGPGSCSRPGASPVLDWVFNHAENGTNAWTGAPARLDFISIHYKGRSTSYLVAEQALEGFTWMRTDNRTGPKVQATPFYNDEADPMVGWLSPEDWRADGRYGSIIPKVVNQHLLQIVDNNTITANNPLGLLSNDNGFMNMDGYNGFSQRTLLARFTDTSNGAYALVRKNGLAAMAMMSKMGSQRVAYTGAAGPDQVALSPTGTIITSDAASSTGPAMVSVLVYANNDTFTAGAGQPSTYPVTVTLESYPFTAADNVMLVHYRIDNNYSNPYAVWTAQGQPPIPNTDQLLAMWGVDGLPILGQPVPVSITAGSPIVIPSFDLPLPGASLLHLAAQPSTPPPQPVGVKALVKAASSSLLDPTRYAEVLVRWDCDVPRAAGSSTGAGAAAPPSPVTLGYTVQASTTGPNGPWSTVQSASVGDITCAFRHAAPPSAAFGYQLWYQVAAVDYWQQQSAWSSAIQAASWPAIE